MCDISVNSNSINAALWKAESYHGNVRRLPVSLDVYYLPNNSSVADQCDVYVAAT